MNSHDPICELQAFINAIWVVAQPRFYPYATVGPRVQPEVTPWEAEYFLQSLRRDGDERPLFEVDGRSDIVRSDREPPNADGAVRSDRFFESPGRLRLETIIGMAAAARLRDKFGWPREHLILESPDVKPEEGLPGLRREAVDGLLLEEPYPILESMMTRAAARSRVVVEAKADKRLLEKLINLMRACEGRPHPDHNKCLALEVFRPQFFLGVAAAETWYLITVKQRDGRAVLGERCDLDWLYFRRASPSRLRRRDSDSSAATSSAQTNAATDG